jgi:SAM-dependent methyltransferase
MSVPLAKVPIVSPNVGVSGEELTKVVAPLDNYLCMDCGLIQLVHVVDPALIYRNYLYRTAVSAGLSGHFKGLCQSAVSRLSLQKGSFIVEFGSNDGTLLQHFKDVGMNVQGIDPAEVIAQEATAKGIPTRADFFDVSTATDIRDNQQKAALILSNNVMANIDDLEPILQGVKTLLADDGVYVFETQYALDVFEKNLLDVIYHEHISCFSVQPVARAFERFGLEVFDAERIPTKGGSIRFWVQHQNGPQPVAARVQELITLENETGLYDLAYHKRFSDKVEAIKSAIHQDVKAVRGAGGKVAAWGTSVGCAALIHQFELEDKIDFFLDDSPFKTRLSGPGYDLPVYKGDGVVREKPALIIVLAWRYADMIIPKHNDYMSEGGRFLIPLPDISTRP